MTWIHAKINGGDIYDFLPIIVVIYKTIMWVHWIHLRLKY